MLSTENIHMIYYHRRALITDVMMLIAMLKATPFIYAFITPIAAFDYYAAATPRYYARH